MELSQIIQLTEDTFRSNNNPDKAAGMKAYMKGQFEFSGIGAPERRILSKIIFDAVKHLNTKDFRKWAEHCWLLPEREFQYLVQDAIDKRKKKLTTSDLNFIEKLILTKSWWDTVDYLAADVIGSILADEHELQGEKTNQWMKSGNMWLERTAILFQLKYGRKTDSELLFSCIAQLKESKEFFIRKAAGWGLRQYSKTDPASVIAFVEAFPSLSALTKKEALRLIKS
jgi:3-methyladenine DNA glycosylase AlkD